MSDRVMLMVLCLLHLALGYFIGRMSNDGGQVFIKSIKGPKSTVNVCYDISVDGIPTSCYIKRIK